MKGKSDKQALERAGNLGFEGSFGTLDIRPEIGPGVGSVAFKPDDIGLEVVFAGGDRGAIEAEDKPEKKSESQKGQDFQTLGVRQGINLFATDKWDERGSAYFFLELIPGTLSLAPI